MCGRFTNRLTWREIVALYRLSVPAEPERNLPARYNICPTDIIDAVIERGGERDPVPVRWGLIPNCGKKPPRKFRRPSMPELKQQQSSQCFATHSGAVAA